jgi:uncharacterized protein (DUF1778 family)
MADLEGTSINHFVVQSAFRQAQEILGRDSIVRLNREQTERVFELLGPRVPQSIPWGSKFRLRGRAF